MTSPTTLRRRMPTERPAVTHKFTIGKLKGYITVGLYEDGTPGEVFLTIQKPGSLERGLSDALAIMISLALQSGIPVAKVAEKLKGLRFEPSGLTGNPSIPQASSIADYIGRWLAIKFCRGGANDTNIQVNTTGS